MDHIRYITAGESHGPELTGIMEGMPAGVPMLAEHINLQLARRQKGYGRGGRMGFEEDAARITSGIRFGLTTAAPIALTIVNKAFQKDKDNWPIVMSDVPVDQEVEKITLPRPGHADLVGTQKYGFDDIRPVIERSSARETTMRVAVGAIARQFLRELGIFIGGHVITLGAAQYSGWNNIREQADHIVDSENAEAISNAADLSEVRCLEANLSQKMKDEIKKVKKEGGSLGGVYEIIVSGLPAGLGSYTHWDRKLDGKLAQAILGTQAMKGVEFGMGFEAGTKSGKDVHDEITLSGGKYGRKTNRAGGLEGGMTTGMPLIIRGVMKPIPTMLSPLDTVDIATHETSKTRYERSDVCALPRAVVVIENIIAPVLANAILDKFGGDSLAQIQKNMA